MQKLLEGDTKKMPHSAAATVSTLATEADYCYCIPQMFLDPYIAQLEPGIILRSQFSLTEIKRFRARANLISSHTDDVAHQMSYMPIERFKQWSLSYSQK
jgi:hypothetical protein